MARHRVRRRNPTVPRAIATPPAEPAWPETRVVARQAPIVERLAYTRSQAAEALGVSRSTFIRRVLPYVDTVEMPWGAKLIPVDELERLVAERRVAAKPRPARTARGRRPLVPAEVIERIRTERAEGASLARIAAGLNADRTPTAHGGAKWWPSTIRSVLAGPEPPASAPQPRQRAVRPARTQSQSQTRQASFQAAAAVISDPLTTSK